MARIEPFEKMTEKYDIWFDKNHSVYLSELMAVSKQLPRNKRSLEIGVGTGRFAGSLGIKFGLEPSGNMRIIAQRRGIRVVGGIAERLPFADNQFSLVLMVTTICFLDDLRVSFSETHRILESRGSFVIGFIDKDSILGQRYLKHKENNEFYRIATFYSVDDVVTILEKTGFRDFSFVQTIFRPLSDINDIEPSLEGYGQGSFVVIKARK